MKLNWAVNGIILMRGTWQGYLIFQTAWITQEVGLDRWAAIGWATTWSGPHMTIHLLISDAPPLRGSPRRQSKWMKLLLLPEIHGAGRFTKVATWQFSAADAFIFLGGNLLKNSPNWKCAAWHFTSVKIVASAQAIFKMKTKSKLLFIDLFNLFLK